MKKFFKWITNLFTSTAKLANSIVVPSIDVVRLLQQIVDSPITPFITAIIPSNVDDKVVDQLQKHLPKVLLQLEITHECTSLTNPQKLFECVVKHLRLSSNAERDAQYKKMANLLSECLADGKLTKNEIAKLVLEYYSIKRM